MYIRSFLLQLPTILPAKLPATLHRPEHGVFTNPTSCFKQGGVLRLSVDTLSDARLSLKASHSEVCHTLHFHELVLVLLHKAMHGVHQRVNMCD